MKTKKWLSVGLAALLVLTSTACSSDTQTEEGVNTDGDYESGGILEGTVWEHELEYTGFGQDDLVAVWNVDGEQLLLGEYTWDGKEGTVRFEDGSTLWIEASDEDPLLMQTLLVSSEEASWEYTLCEQLPEFMTGYNDPSADPAQENVPDSLRPTFLGGLEVDESRIGENLGGDIAALAQSTWMIGDDFYTFFPDGYVDAVNILIGDSALGTYSIAEDGTVLCLMDNGAEIMMEFHDEQLTLDGKEMTLKQYNTDRDAPHRYTGPGTLVGYGYLDRDSNEELCFLANEILVLYYPDTAAAVVGSYQWNDDGTGKITVDGNTMKTEFRNGHLYTETPQGMKPLDLVHPEQESYEFVGMERVLIGTWEWTENPDIELQIITTGAGNTYDTENSSGTVWAETMTYDGEYLVLEWPVNDGMFNGTMVGQMLGDGSLTFEGWDGWFVRIN